MVVVNGSVVILSGKHEGLVGVVQKTSEAGNFHVLIAGNQHGEDRNVEAWFKPEQLEGL
ncbi:MAG: hypothetical protein Q7U78_05965 [Gallionella sp.]|nr:hypothetical protein [Gallionella sp.]